MKNVVITGSSRGIGFELVNLFNKNNYNVIALSRNLSSISKLNLNNVSTFSTDLSDSSSINKAVKFINNKFSSVDILINNAGIQHVAKIEDFPPEKWQLLINIMLVAPAMLTQAFLPGMRERNFGRIINVGSIHSVIASPYKSAYVAAKHGLLGFAKTIALETGEHDITINTLCPAYVKTPLVEAQIAKQAIENGISEEDVVNKIMLEPMPKKSFIEISELAQTANFLISAGAKNITGQTLILDGGWTAR